MYRYITDSVYMQTHISTDYLYTHRNYTIPFCITKKTSSRDAFSFVISSQLGDDPVLKFREGRKEDRSDHFVPATHFKFKTVHRKFYFFWLFQILGITLMSHFFSILYPNDFYKKNYKNLQGAGTAALFLFVFVNSYFFAEENDH